MIGSPAIPSAADLRTASDLGPRRLGSSAHLGEAKALKVKSDYVLQQIESENGAWARFKARFQKVSKQENALNAFSWKDNGPATLVAALECAQTPQLRIKLRKIIGGLSDSQQNELLQEVAKRCVENAPCAHFIENFLGLISLEELTTASKMSDEELRYPEQLREIMKECQGSSLLNGLGLKIDLPKMKTSTSILHFFHSLLDTLLTALGEFGPGREPTASFEAYQMLIVYGQLFSFPIIVLGILNAIVGAVAALVIVGSTIALLILVYHIYTKWLKPCPQDVAPLINLSKELREKGLPPIIGREYELESAIKMLKEGLWVLVKGKKGIGKTNFGYALARALKDTHTVFRVNVANLIDTNPYSFDKLSRLAKRLEEYKKKGVNDKNGVVIILESFEAAIGTPLQTKLKDMLDGFHVVATCTDTAYEEKLLKDEELLDRFSFGEIKLNSLSEEHIQYFLKMLASQHALDIHVADDAIEEIAKFTGTPRVAEKFLQRALADIRTQKSKVISENELALRQSKEKRDLALIQFRLTMASEEALKLGKIVVTLNGQIKDLEKACQDAKKDTERSRKYRMLLQDNRDRLFSLACQMNQAVLKKEENLLRKHFFFVKQLLIPKLQEALKLLPPIPEINKKFVDGMLPPTESQTRVRSNSRPNIKDNLGPALTAVPPVIVPAPPAEDYAKHAFQRPPPIPMGTAAMRMERLRRGNSPLIRKTDGEAKTPSHKTDGT